MKIANTPSATHFNQDACSTKTVSTGSAYIDGKQCSFTSSAGTQRASIKEMLHTMIQPTFQHAEQAVSPTFASSDGAQTAAARAFIKQA
jgi:hypothetical protein